MFSYQSDLLTSLFYKNYIWLVALLFPPCSSCMLLGQMFKQLGDVYWWFWFFVLFCFLKINSQVTEEQDIKKLIYL